MEVFELHLVGVATIDADGAEPMSVVAAAWDMAHNLILVAAVRVQRADALHQLRSFVDLRAEVRRPLGRARQLLNLFRQLEQARFRLVPRPGLVLLGHHESASKSRATIRTNPDHRADPDLGPSDQRPGDGSDTRRATRQERGSGRRCSRRWARRGASRRAALLTSRAMASQRSLREVALERTFSLYVAHFALWLALLLPVVATGSVIFLAVRSAITGTLGPDATAEIGQASIAAAWTAALVWGLAGVGGEQSARCWCSIGAPIPASTWCCSRCCGARHACSRRQASCSS